MIALADVPRRWWGARTLHTRLSLLVTAAVAAAVVAVAGLAFAAVSEIQRHQIEAQLDADARAVAAGEVLAAGPPPRLPVPGGLNGRDGIDSPDTPGGPGGRGDVPRRGHRGDLGVRWQVIDAQAGVVSRSTEPLPVTGGAAAVAAGRLGRVQEEIVLNGHRYLMLTVRAERDGGSAVQVAINQDPATRTLTAFGLLLVVACAAGIAGAAWLGRTVARAGLAPVQRLTAAVEHVAVTMDLNRPVPVHGADEIARLGQSVNTMLSAIDASRRAQRTLVEDAGHELRTPLTSLRTNIELLLEVERHPELAHRLPPEDRARLLQDLEAQVGELAALTTELVELAREEASREPVERVSFTDVVEAAVERVRFRAPALEFTTELRPATVKGRPGELERMVVNILDNAAKWSPPGGTVHVELHAEGPGHCRLRVADTGPGIDEADRPHVFDRFYRAAAARGAPGSGLGLAIVAQTVAQHGGAVAATPNIPHGTVMTIRLPLAGPAGGS